MGGGEEDSKSIQKGHSECNKQEENMSTTPLGGPFVGRKPREFCRVERSLHRDAAKAARISSLREGKNEENVLLSTR